MADPLRSSADLGDLLAKELDDRLTPAERAALEAAAAADPAVAREREGWRRVRAAMAADAVVPVRPGLAEEIAAAARRAPAPIVVGPWRRAASAAAAILLSVGVFGLGRASVREPQDVVAGGSPAQKAEAALREWYSVKLGVSDALIEEILQIDRRYERRTEEALRALQPEIDALNRARVEEKWRKLPPEVRKRWLELDPRLVPPEISGAAGAGK